MKRRISLALLCLLGGAAWAQNPQVELSGDVTDRQFEPVYQARVQVSNASGQYKTLTDTSGHFSLTVPAGRQEVTVLTRTCEPLKTVVNLASAHAPLQLVLDHRFGTIAAHLYSFVYENSHYRPVKVEMWEDTNPSNHYTNFYNQHWRRPRTDAYWKPFPLGAAYTVQVTWQDQNGNQLWGKHGGRAMQSLNNVDFYNSWS